MAEPIIKPKRPPQTRTGLTDTGVKKAADKSARTRSREFALQALYQHLVGRNEADSIDAFTRNLVGFHKADSAHYDALLHGCIESAQARVLVRRNDRRQPRRHTSARQKLAHAQQIIGTRAIDIDAYRAVNMQVYESREQCRAGEID